MKRLKKTLACGLFGLVTGSIALLCSPTRARASLTNVGDALLANGERLGGSYVFCLAVSEGGRAAVPRTPNAIVLYVGAALVMFWGIAHLFPTRSVVKGFGDISLDNQRIIAMEWIVEGVSLIFIGLLVAVVTYTDAASRVAGAVYWLSFAMLIALAIVSLCTGFRVNFLPFKLCPLIFSGSALLILLGSR